MTFIDSLGRSRFGTFLAWLAVASLGALATQRDAAGVHAFDEGAQVSLVRALVDAPTHVVRLGAIKLAAHVRGDDDDRRGPAGPVPVLLPSQLWLSAQAAGTAFYAVRIPAGGENWPVAPYAARAPPPASI